MSERRRDQAIKASLHLLETEGEAAVSMRRVAAEMGLRASSLYKHVSGRDELVAGMQAEGLRAMGRALSEAPTATRAQSRLAALGRAYRAFALARPALYRVTTGQPLHREYLPSGLEDSVAAVLVEAVGGDRDRARATWALAHGLVDLELSGRFPPEADLETAWDLGLGALAVNRAADRR